MRIASAPAKLRRFAGLQRREKWQFIRAVGWLALARLQLVTTPFGKLAARLSEGSERVPEDPDPDLLRQVSAAVVMAAANVPWRSDCFVQTIAARNMLRRHGIGSTIHLGVDKDEDSGILGHAWLTCGDEVVTGGRELSRYVEIHRLGQ